MTAKPAPNQNQLLAALPAHVQNRLFPHLQLVTLPFGKALHESGQNISHVYFPVDSIVSLLNVMEDGASAEISAIGNEGLIGVPLFTGVGIASSRAVVLCGGSAYRMPGAKLKEEIKNHGELEHLLLRYMQALMIEMGQAAVCNRHHSIEQQLSRWLLLSLDRLQSDTLNMTQELISNMLGVRRESITDAAGKLRKKGIIVCNRGKITVQDRQQLEQQSCECYAVVKKEIAQLMSSSASFIPRRRIMRQLIDRRERHRIEADNTQADKDSDSLHHLDNPSRKESEFGSSFK